MRTHLTLMNRTRDKIQGISPKGSSSMKKKASRRGSSKPQCFAPSFRFFPFFTGAGSRLICFAGTVSLAVLEGFTGVLQKTHALELKIFNTEAVARSKACSPSSHVTQYQAVAEEFSGRGPPGGGGCRKGNHSGALILT